MGNPHAEEKLRRRTKDFAVAVVLSTRSLPRTRECDIIAKQVLRAALSIAASYRAACRCRSRAEFISKINVTLEEADETLFWLEALEDLDIGFAEILQTECKELVCIFAASLRTARRRAVSIGTERDISDPNTNQKSQIANR